MTPALAEHDRDETLLTASEIAEFAGVSPSAVSNWRKRFDDFPRAAGTAATGGDLFRLSEVQGWLASRPTPSSKRAPDTREQLWGLADRLRGKALSADLGVIVAVAAAFVARARELGAAPDKLPAEPNDLSPWLRATIEKVEQAQPELSGLFAPLADLEPEDARALLDTLNDRSNDSGFADAVDQLLSRTARYSDFRTTPAVAELLVQLARPYSAVLDPACGSGEFLLRAAAQNEKARLYGQELDEDGWRIAMTRLLLHRVDAEVALGDSFVGDAFAGLHVDAVLCEPPAGHRFPNFREPAGDSRWQILGTIQPPLRRAAHFAWLAHAVAHLAQDGRAVVLLPTGSLVRGGLEAKFRAELLRQGSVETIITLESGALQNSPAPAAVWILRTPQGNPGDVLLVASEHGVGAGSDEVHGRILDVVKTWRTVRQEFTSVAGFATSVPVSELLEGETSLLPSRWLFDPMVVEPEPLVASVEADWRALADCLDGPALPLPQVDLEPVLDRRPRLRVRDLVDQGLATIVRPGRLKLDEFGDEGVPVWLPGDVRRPWEKQEPPKFVDSSKVDPKWLTKPGDVVLTTVGGIRTRVDTEGGHVLGTSLQALRLRSEALDPEVIAELLVTEPNRRLVTGTTIPRVSVFELEIPLLDLAEARQLNRVLQALERHEERGHMLARRAGELRTAVTEAVVTGAARLQLPVMEEDDG